MKIKLSGFREYDARWLYPQEIDIEGFIELGKGLRVSILYVAEGAWARCPVCIHAHVYTRRRAGVSWRELALSNGKCRGKKVIRSVSKRRVMLSIVSTGSLSLTL